MTENLPHPSDFKDLRQAGHYVDKTTALSRLASHTYSQLWLRPAGFGQSVMTDALAALFSEGRSALSGLSGTGEWKEAPYKVIRLNFWGLPPCRTSDELEAALDDRLLRTLEAAGYRPKSYWGNFPCMNAGFWLDDQPLLSTVILMEDFDLPMVEHLGEPELFKTAQGWMDELTANIRSADASRRAWIMTGTFNFLSGNIFSGVDYDVDSSLDDESAALVGFTDAEIRQHFGTELKRAAGILGSTEDGVMEMLAACGGYSFDGIHPNPTTAGLFRTSAVTDFFADPVAGVRPRFFRTPAEEKAVTAWLRGKTLELTDGVTYARWDELSTPMMPDDLRIEEVLFAVGCLTLTARRNTHWYTLAIPNRTAAEALERFGVTVDDRTYEDRWGSR